MKKRPASSSRNSSGKTHDEYGADYILAGPLDMFGFFGDEMIPFSMVLKSTRAKNALIEQFPDTGQFLKAKSGNTWSLSGVLNNKKSLSVACAFYLGLADEVDISSCQPLKEVVNQRLTDLVSRL